jgi:hypothetical protein
VFPFPVKRYTKGFASFLLQNSENLVVIIFNMPRENRLTRAARLTRSGRREPLWETVIFLQETVKKLGRQLRHGEKTQEEIRLELQDVQNRLEVYISSERALILRNRELE